MEGGKNTTGRAILALLIAVSISLQDGRVAVAGDADGAPLRLQLFSDIDREVVAVGQPFTITVEFLSSSVVDPRPEEAFSASIYDFASSGIELVRAEPVERRIDRVGEDGSVLILSRRFVLRSGVEGRHRIPPFAIEVDGRSYQTRAYDLEVYRPAPILYDVMDGVVRVEAEAAWDRSVRVVQLGTAFAVRGDALVTSYHVIAGADRVHLHLPDGRKITTDRVWAVDPARDVAVLYADSVSLRQAGVRPLALAGAERREGERISSAVFTYGRRDSARWSTAGLLLSVMWPNSDLSTYVTSNGVRPGDSGGPMVDDRGRVLGVVSVGRFSLDPRHHPQEGLCLATDPTRVMEDLARAERPRRLAAVRAAPEVVSSPYARVLKAASSIKRTLAVSRYEAALRLETHLEELYEAGEGEPREPVLHFIRALTYEMIGAHWLALDAYRRSLELEPENFLASYSVGLMQLDRGHYAAAEATFERMIDGPMYGRRAHFGLARALIGMHRYEEAIAHLSEIVHHTSLFPHALYLFGYCLLAAGDETGARQILVRLEEQDKKWAHRLRLTIEVPVFRPMVLRELPRARFKLACETSESECWLISRDEGF